jgi:DNA-binding transcriptional regulator YhcF (GntR family)
MLALVTPFQLTVDRDSEVPLGTQLGWQLRALIRTGRAAPGARLPGVRELAEQAGVNVNTVRGVYARLEEEGLIASEHGRGTFVAPGAAQRTELARVLADAVAEATSAGLDPREVAAALFVATDLGAEAEAPDGEGAAAGRGGARGADATAGGSGRGGGQAGKADDDEPGGGAPAAAEGERARRRRLRDAIAELDRELVYLAPLGAPRERPRLPAGRILTADELEDVRDRLALHVEELRAERAEARRRALEPPAPEPAAAPAPRVWRSAGVWTGPHPRPASFGA